jgi:hypothetical protein
LCALLLASGATQAASPQPLRILNHEIFSPRAESTVGQRKTDSATRYKFDAFGRHFALTLEKNDSLAQWADTLSPTLSLYRGTLDNVPGSWARMSAKGQQIRGMIWDGHDLYIIDPGAAAEPDATKPSAQTIIYRLADTQIEPGIAFCGSTESVSGKAAYSSLVEELKGSPGLMQAAGASLRLQIAALADQLLRARYTSDEEARDEILTRFNNVDGIYSSQLGVEVQISSFDIDNATTDQLSTSTNANTLVKSLATVRSKSSSQRARGLTHLFTGRDLDGTTVGIAYTDSLCSSQWGVGLTQMGRSVGIDSLITAHEIGHNFGAVHDGEKQCASTPVSQFIMSPTVNPNAITFSSCSLDAMLPRKRSASCLAALPPPDLTLSSDATNKSGAIHEAINWSVMVTNVGGSGAQAARLSVTVPASIMIKNVSVEGVECSKADTTATCDLGDMAAGGSREIRGVLEGTQVGSFTLNATASAANENSTSNNSAQGTLVITPEVDLAISLTAPSSIVVGTSGTLNLGVQNMTSTTAQSLDVQLTVPSSLSVASAQIGNTACQIQDAVIHCAIATLTAGESISGSFTVTATAAGSASVKASISGSDFDANATNNAVERTITISSPVSVQSTTQAAKNGGGGGDLSWTLLAMLAGFIVRRRSIA